MRTHGAACAVLISVALLTACARPRTAFDVSRALAHVQMLAGTIGSRPVGTSPNARAREYAVAQLEKNLFQVRVQEADGIRPERGMTARVFNVIARRPGRSDDAIALVAHYDSVAAGPGAGDDGFGAAVAMEAGRVLAARADRRHTLFVLLTDGEEAGLFGAAALIQDRTIVDRIRAYINLESIGSGWPLLLFETGPGGAWLVDAWARSAPYPRGSSFSYEIYQRLPQDTDFSVFRRAGLAGLNFALIGDSPVYHTDRDDVNHLDETAVDRAGHNIVSVVEALDRMDLSSHPPRHPSAAAALGAPPQTTDEPVYFDVLGRIGVVYGRSTARTLLIVAIIAGLIAWIRAVAVAIRTASMRHVVRSIMWMLVGGLAVPAAMIGASWLLRATRDELHPWYAHPTYLLLLLLSVGASAAFLIGNVAARSPWHGSGHPAAVWCLVLPLWLVTASTLEWLAPSAGFLWTLPLVLAGVVLAVAPLERRSHARWASAVVLVGVGVLWIPNTLDLFYFLISIVGREPLVTPVWIYAVYLSGCGLMVALPLVAALAGVDRSVLMPPALFCALGTVVSVMLAFQAPAYSNDRPLRRYVRYVQQEANGRAFWEIGGNEAVLDIAADSTLQWERAELPLTATGSASLNAPGSPRLRSPANPASFGEARRPPSFTAQRDDSELRRDLAEALASAGSAEDAEAAPPLAGASRLPARQPPQALPRERGTRSDVAKKSPPLEAAELGPFPYPFVFRAAAQTLAPPPATVSTVIEPDGGEVRLNVSVTPLEAGIDAALVLPPGLTPRHSNLVGAIDDRGAWSATVIALPEGGITFTAVFELADRASLEHASLVLRTSQLPGGGPGAAAALAAPGGGAERRLPRWLSTVRTAWNGAAYFIIPVTFGD